MNTSPSLLLQAAEQAAGGQTLPTGALYVVATPIGNLADLTLRAIHVLALADTVACEDTRVGGALLQHLGLRKPLLPLHQHNEAAAAGHVIHRLAAGERVVLVSDAGTPAVSDPGARLVAAVAAAGHRVLPIPGPSSALAALSVAGDATATAFMFQGFLPAKGREREAALAAVLAAPGAQILFEAPHRIETLAAALAAAAPMRTVTLCRELTKQFETVHTAPAGDLPAWLAADANRLRGEFVLVLHALPPTAGDDDIDPAALRALDVLQRELPLKQAVALAAEISGAPRNALYALALSRKQGEN
ncbi:16S rRNA (cytidine(1402)-2'-O)-methyltransferase [Rubrivivax albus]|uniref:Ribosomal RNA small subunit methyltransferase I n=1 Tax=Rubrivivax albus TaxID=2499835 RepID=A0A437JMM5_9BURK|nr:16S rRNA (cytidine(1402)-2'-O)-methyltransferase [Rubrivivax albus]RVT48079.1 16S rRNA (cytidine(1402)-2'-O)-methyltransferase [Rubrivivax albus]